VDELAEIESPRRAYEAAHSVAEHEQEEHWLDQPAHDPGSGPDVTDQFSFPHHANDANLVGDVRVATWGRGCGTLRANDGHAVDSVVILNASGHHGRGPSWGWPRRAALGSRAR